MASLLIERLKKRWCVILVTLLVISLALTFDVIHMPGNSGQSFLIRPDQIRDIIVNSPTNNMNVTDDPHDPRFYNIIMEEEALMFEPCQDINKTPSIQHSKVSLADRLNGSYNIGEEIRAVITLYDGYGKRKYSGGDHLRATIESKTPPASAPCVVSDNKDGTHTVACEALWSGTSTISVTLAYSRETITTIYRIRTQVLATRNIYAMFKSRTYKEESTCHPSNTHLQKLTNYTELCDMTYMNSGMPFYCGKPKDEHLLCQDWQLVRTHEPYPHLQVTECEEALLKSGQRALTQTIMVNIHSGNGNNRVSAVDRPSIPCSLYNISHLWQTRGPTGFFYDGKWNLRNCIGFQEKDYSTCLKNTSLYLFGDSTSRAWYLTIRKRFKCQPTTEKWQTEKWHKETECYNKQFDFKAGWYPHAQPFFVGQDWDDVRYTLYSTSRRIDNIPRDKRAIVVIHLYMHLLAFHHNVFKERMKIIRKSIETLLLSNKQSVIMIKAPHTFEGTPAGSVRLSDYFGYVYSKILFEVFEGLHDRVVLLNNRDTTIAQHVKWNHPPEHIVNAMVDQMLSYACNP